MQQVFAEIEAEASESGVVDLGHYVLCGIRMPAAWDAADLTFLASWQDDGAAVDAWVPVHDGAGDEVALTVEAATHVVLAPSVTAGLRFVKLQSGVADTPVEQTAAREFVLILRPAV